MDRTGNRVIHVKHLVGYILKRWKLLLLGMLVGVCIFSVFGYISIKKTQKQQAPVEKRTEIAVTEAEFASVQDIIDFEAMLEEKEGYMENSVLMQIDPIHKWSCVDVYTVTFIPEEIEGDLEKEQTVEGAKVPLEKNGNVPETVNRLIGLFSEQDFWERLSDKTNDKVEVGYLREIVSVAAISADRFKVIVIHKGEEKVRGLSDLVEECLQEIISEDGGLKRYQLINDKGSPIVSVDNMLIENQKNAQVQLIGVRDTLAYRKTELKDNEREYLDAHFDLLQKGFYMPLWKQGIKLYDTVRLKRGEVACIVELLGDSKICYVADVEMEEGTETDFIYPEDIAEVLE